MTLCMAALVSGVKIGLLLSIFIGPIFFLLIQTSAEEGLRSGLRIGLGIWVSDMLYILLAYFGLATIRKILESEQYPLIAGSIGGGILLIFGFTALLLPPKTPNYPGVGIEIPRSSFLSLFFKGVMVNGFNPFTGFFWLGIMSTVLVDRNFSQQEIRTFFLTTLLTIMLLDVLKMLLSDWISTYFKPVHYLWLRRISGAALMAFGIGLIVRVWLGG